jgi:uncharacterized membrane protein
MDKIKGLFTNLQDKTADYSKEEIENGKLMALLSYIGILALIPYFAEKENKYVRFHAIQGLNLLIINLVVSAASFVVAIVATVLFIIPIIGWILGFLLYLVIGLVPVGLFVISILGIVYSLQGNAKELPIVNQIKFIKE